MKLKAVITIIYEPRPDQYDLLEVKNVQDAIKEDQVCLDTDPDTFFTWLQTENIKHTITVKVERI